MTVELAPREARVPDILGLRDDLPAFRSAVRAWLSDAVPAGWDGEVADDEVAFVSLQRRWMEQRRSVGLAMAHWPKAYGGADLSLLHQIILSDEFARAHAPIATLYTVAFNHVPGTLLSWGTEEQRRRHLSGIADRGTVWCQGFSEPGAGSDLAALRTRAERRGDKYIVNGQKIWSSQSMHADWCILLARTDPDAPKHAGISFFLMDMKSPGVEVRPIRQINHRSEFAEIFLTDVEIPAENLVGGEGDGWKVAQATLSSERGVLAFEYVERARYAFESFYAQALESDAAWLRDDQLRREFIGALLDLQMNRRLLRKLLGGAHTGSAGPNQLASYIKLHGSTMRQKASALMTRVGGLAGQQATLGFEDFYYPAMFTYLTAFSWTIAAGSNEIMRNIIAERILGMPKG
jgi:alkylation response protein AidB-like acyl-CoA dehydrogenase